MGKRSGVLGFLAVSSLWLHGCAKGPVAAAPSSTTDAAVVEECLSGPSGTPIRAEIAVSFSDPVDLHVAPIPRNESERILFRHLYETLVRIDCNGDIHPGLAFRWWKHEGGRMWEFELRDRARFSDGSPLSAEDVKAAWLFGSQSSGPYFRPLWSWVRPESVLVTEAGHLVVYQDRPHGDGPGMFVHPALAVARPSGEGSVIPLGSGPYLVTSGVGDTLLCEPNPFHPDPGFCPLRVAVVAGADPRDLVGEGGDVVVVHDREAVNYASSVPTMRVVPLSWDTLYLLASSCIRERESDSMTDLDDLRRELATTIAASEARPVRGFTHDPADEPDCVVRSPTEDPGQPSASPTEVNILFWADDADAEHLASRLVALEDPEDSTASGLPCVRPESIPVGVGETWERFFSSLISGEDWAYVLGIGREFPDPCLDLDMLLDQVPWMRSASVLQGSSPPKADFRRVAVPLIVTRASLVCRKSLLRVERGWDGIPLLHRAGWADRRQVQ